MKNRTTWGRMEERKGGGGGAENSEGRLAETRLRHTEHRAWRHKGA